VEPDLSSLFVIAVVAALAPILADIPRRARVAVVVVELVLGIVIGPQVLDLARPDPFVDFLANLGLAALFFLAGAEIDFPAIRGRPLRTAGGGWLVSLALGLAAGWILAHAGVVDDPEIVGIALATTALGVLVPILRDAGLSATRFGTMALAVGTVGELGPIVLLSVVLAAGGESLTSALLLIAFAAVALATAALSVHVHPARLVRLARETMHASGQLAVRICMLLLLALVFLAIELRQDLVLGAFAAGIVLGVATRGHEGLEPLRVKLDGIAYGLLVPVFFIRSGMTFDLDGLLESPAALAELPLFLALLLLVRGLPALLHRRALPEGTTAPLALLSASALPLVVAITEVGVRTGELASDTAASLVGAAVLSVLIFPSAALALLERRGRAPGPT
jgi:Kef-type K+ transport system membrane component KefB